MLFGNIRKGAAALLGVGLMVSLAGLTGCQSGGNCAPRSSFEEAWATNQANARVSAMPVAARTKASTEWTRTLDPNTCEIRTEAVEHGTSEIEMTGQYYGPSALGGHDRCNPTPQNPTQVCPHGSMNCTHCHRQQGQPPMPPATQQGQPQQSGCNGCPPGSPAQPYPQPAPANR